MIVYSVHPSHMDSCNKAALCEGHGDVKGVAECIRMQGAECFGHDGKRLPWVHLHTGGPDYNDDALADPPSIARFESMARTRPVATRNVDIHD